MKENKLVDLSMDFAVEVLEMTDFIFIRTTENTATNAYLPSLLERRAFFVENNACF